MSRIIKNLPRGPILRSVLPKMYLPLFWLASSNWKSIISFDRMIGMILAAKFQ